MRRPHGRRATACEVRARRIDCQAIARGLARHVARETSRVVAPLAAGILTRPRNTGDGEARRFLSVPHGKNLRPRRVIALPDAVPRCLTCPRAGPSMRLECVSAVQFAQRGSLLRERCNLL